MQFYTYIYKDPSRLHNGFPEPIYVGKGQKLRAWDHLKREDNHPFSNRLRKMLRANVVPEIEIVPALDEAHAHFLEECLISVLGRKDLKQGTLLNLTNGGEGCAGRVVSQIEKDNKRLMKKERWSDPENRERYCANMVAAQNRPEVKAQTSAIQKIAQNRPEVKAKKSASKSRACTVDGIIIFPSRRALVAALGKGKAGTRSPTFRHIQKDKKCS